MIRSPLPDLNAREGALPEGEGNNKKPHHGFFITGTDTGVGKTRISVGIMRALQQQGLRVAGMKPLASGCEVTADGLRNEDALLLQQHASEVRPYDIINPYAFAPAIAPHLAAQQAGVHITMEPILERFTSLAAHSDAVVVEGAGGWLVPLNDEQSIADLAVALQLPVIIVVAIRLGCINHALLTAQAVRASGCTVAGWVANHLTAPADEAAAIIRSIETRIEAPLLGEIGYSPSLEIDRIAHALDTTALLQSLAN